MQENPLLERHKKCFCFIALPFPFSAQIISIFKVEGKMVPTSLASHFFHIEIQCLEYDFKTLGTSMCLNLHLRAHKSTCNLHPLTSCYEITHARWSVKVDFTMNSAGERPAPVLHYCEGQIAPYLI